MEKKFQNKYRIPSARAPWWDYGQDAAYFVTMCTKDRKHFFGDVVNGIMKLSHVGIIADLLWNEIKNHADNIELDEYVVMPNHVHGIVILNGNRVGPRPRIPRPIPVPKPGQKYPVIHNRVV